MKVKFIVLAVMGVLSSQVSFAQSWTPGPASAKETLKVLEAVQKKPSNLTAQALSKTIDLGIDLGMYIDTSKQASSVRAQRLSQPQYYSIAIHMNPLRGEAANRSEGFLIEAEVLLSPRGAYVFNFRTERLTFISPHPGVGMGNR